MKIPKPRLLPSGNWFIQLRINGTSIPVTAGTGDECIALAGLYKSGTLTPPPPESRGKNGRIGSGKNEITLSEACTKYIESRKNRLEASTKQGYEKIRDNDFPNLMKMKLCQIDNGVLDREVESECGRISPRTNKKYSRKSIRNNYMFIVSVLKKYAPNVNTDVSLPEIKRKPVKIIKPEHIYPIIKGTAIELPCLLSMWLSLTMSEIRGLTKSKSIYNGQLSVCETVVDIHGKPVRKEGGKEEERTRTYNLPVYLQRLIDDVPGDIIVPLTAQAITKRFYRLLEKNGLPHMAFHKLRHINASVMAMLRVPEKDALDRGGWKTDNVYKQVYTHVFTEQRSAADAAIDAYFEAIVGQNANEIANEKKEQTS